MATSDNILLKLHELLVHLLPQLNKFPRVQLLPRVPFRLARRSVSQNSQSGAVVASEGRAKPDGGAANGDPHPNMKKTAPRRGRDFWPKTALDHGGSAAGARTFLSARPPLPPRSGQECPRSVE